MSNQVFANNMEISCKAANGKSICAFPDVCFTPPMTPFTPPGVPIPYPNTGMASDCTAGSTTVKISGQEVMLKNISFFKRSSGDEAGVAAKKGVITSMNMGKVYFTAWSMDVKVEGENVVRMLDLTTHNHMASMPGNTPPWPYIDTVAVPAVGGGAGGSSDSASAKKCSKEKKAEQQACSGKTGDEQCANAACQTARKCILVPAVPDKRAGEVGCCNGKTPHHLLEVHCFTKVGERKSRGRLPNFSQYDDRKAPCVCCDTASRFKGDHGTLHAVQNMKERSHMNPTGPRSQMGGDGTWTYGAAKAAALTAHKATFPKSGCSAGCTAAQLDAYHHKIGVKDDSTPLRADRSPLKDEQKKLGRKIINPSSF
jgi:Domain of unknown function (DUF4150)/GHH signature containing HNH/Endo VII superfamily nuclease toxin  2